MTILIIGCADWIFRIVDIFYEPLLLLVIIIICFDVNYQMRSRYSIAIVSSLYLLNFISLMYNGEYLALYHYQPADYFLWSMEFICFSNILNAACWRKMTMTIIIILWFHFTRKTTAADKYHVWYSPRAISLFYQGRDGMDIFILFHVGFKNDCQKSVFFLSHC